MQVAVYVPDELPPQGRIYFLESGYALAGTSYPGVKTHVLVPGDTWGGRTAQGAPHTVHHHTLTTWSMH